MKIQQVQRMAAIYGFTARVADNDEARDYSFVIAGPVLGAVKFQEYTQRDEERATWAAIDTLIDRYAAAGAPVTGSTRAHGALAVSRA